MHGCLEVFAFIAHLHPEDKVCGFGGVDLFMTVECGDLHIRNLCKRC